MQACEMLNNILQEFSPATKSAAIHSEALYQKSINILRQRIASFILMKKHEVRVLAIELSVFGVSVRDLLW